MKTSNEKIRSTIQKRDASGVIRHGAEWLTLWSDPDSVRTEAEKRAVQSQLRARIAFERQLAATVRSLSGKPELQISFSGYPDSSQSSCFLSETDVASDPRASTAMRGKVDAYAFLQRFHSPEIHGRYLPSDSSLLQLFGLCEQVRCEAIGMEMFPGVRTNIIAHHLDRLIRSDLLNAHLASLVPVAEALRIVLCDSLLQITETSVDSAGFRMWDQWIRARFRESLDALRAARLDQDLYAPLSVAFLRSLIQELGSAEGRKRRFNPTTSRPGSDQGDEHDDEAFDRRKEDVDGNIFEPGRDLLRMIPPDTAILPNPEPVQDHAQYKAYSTAHDAVIHVADIGNMISLRAKYAELESKYTDYRRDLSRLVLQLQRRLQCRQIRNWAFDLEEGLIDASRLDRVIVNPGFATPYKQEQESEFRDSVVSILIDNSGSMRGKPIETACLVSGMLSAALERCNVSCEILGFTTGEWRGGKSGRDWSRSGRPKNPGRLNDLLHIIYKSPEEPARRAKFSLCAMLDDSLLKENIDGEALLWASRRLLNRKESRKILIVISDGAPADETTLRENQDKAILVRHLRSVVTEIEKAGDIELAAIGVKHDVTQHYRSSIQIDRIENLGSFLIRLVDRLLPG